MSGVWSYALGVGKSDITGPASEIGMMGFGKLGQRTAGILNRLYARAFIIESNNKRMVFVNCDLEGVFQIVHQQVLAKLNESYGDTYSVDNVVLHAMHTHAGPGGSSASTMFVFTTLGFVRETFDAIVSGIYDAIVQAHENMHRDGSIRVSQGQLRNCGKNRSPTSYKNNPEAERREYASMHDSTMTLLQFRKKDGSLLGLLTFFPIHPTNLPSSNRLISGDNKGYAEWLMEKDYPGVIVGFGQSNAGDISPNMIDKGDGTFTGVGRNPIESAEIMGKRQVEKAKELLVSKKYQELKGDVEAKTVYVDFGKVKIKTGESTCSAVLGQAFGAGTADGRGVPTIREGDLKPNFFMSNAGKLLKGASNDLKKCHHPKVPFVATGEIAYTPNILPVQVIRIGDGFGLLTIPFEVTTMAGRRLKKALKKALKVQMVDIAAISNGYALYLTTKEEYAIQNYEGGATLFGPNQLAAVQQEMLRVAKSIMTKTFIERGPVPTKYDVNKLKSFLFSVKADHHPLGKPFGSIYENRLIKQYARRQTAEVVFVCGNPRKKGAQVSSFCDVEKLQDDGKWKNYLTDSDWNVRFLWKRTFIAVSICTCQWVIGDDVDAGTYRFLHRGFRRRTLSRQYVSYEGTSTSFDVITPF